MVVLLHSYVVVFTVGCICNSWSSARSRSECNRDFDRIVKTLSLCSHPDGFSSFLTSSHRLQSHSKKVTKETHSENFHGSREKENLEYSSALGSVRDSSSHATHCAAQRVSLARPPSALCERFKTSQD